MGGSRARVGRKSDRVLPAARPGSRPGVIKLEPTFGLTFEGLTENKGGMTVLGSFLSPVERKLLEILEEAERRAELAKVERAREVGGDGG